MSEVILKDNKFNHFFCDKWNTVKPFLQLWESVAKRFLVKKALQLIISVGDKKYLECADLHK